MNKAEMNMVSIIQGPPGTGKTHTVSSLALILSIKEKNKIMLCAPSNYAADAIASTLEKLRKMHKIQTNVIRIYSKSKEKIYLHDGE